MTARPAPRSVAGGPCGAALCGAVLALASLPATAQDVVGRAVIGGKPVTLFSDNTWAYGADTQGASGAAACLPIARPISFCGAPERWQRSTGPANPDLDAQFRFSDRLFGLLIVEELGTQDGFSEDLLRDTALRTFAAAANTTPDQIEILDTFDSMVDGQTVPTMAYRGDIDGLGVVYVNTFIVRARDTTQAITVSIARDLDDGHRERHSEYLSLLRIAR